ncbi:unnamed protein product [Urochloa humidicola]
MRLHHKCCGQMRIIAGEHGALMGCSNRPLVQHQELEHVLHETGLEVLWCYTTPSMRQKMKFVLRSFKPEEEW